VREGFNFHTFIYFKYTRLKNHKKLSFVEDFEEFLFVLAREFQQLKH